MLPVEPLDALLLAIETIKTNLSRISEETLTSIETLVQHPGLILGVVQAGLSETAARAIIPNVCEGHKASVNSVAFSSDGTIISGSSDNKILLWNNSGNPTRLLPLDVNKDYFVNSIASGFNKKIVVSGNSDSIVRVWSFDGTLLYSLEGHEDSVKSVALSLDEKIIVSGSDDKTVRLWNIEGETSEQLLCGHKDSVNSVAFSPDGKVIVSGSKDKTVRLWNIEVKPLRKFLHAHEKSVNSVAFSPDGKMIVSGSEDTTIRLWNIEGKTSECDRLCPIWHPPSWG